LKKKNIFIDDVLKRIKPGFIRKMIESEPRPIPKQKVLEKLEPINEVQFALESTVNSNATTRIIRIS